MIKPEDLVDKFRYAIKNNWGYIWGTAGILWTAARQKNATRESTVKYGAQWIGHYVADCSGMFSWAFKQLGGYMYHGSNTMFEDYCTAKGKLLGGQRSDGKLLKPGTAVFTGTDERKSHGHVGLYVGDGKVIEASGTKVGVIESKATDKKWTFWGELKGVEYGDPEPDPHPAKHPILRKGDKGPEVKYMQELLLKHGEKLPRYGADGSFGNETKNALMQFQRTHKDPEGKQLVVDGICGPKTWGALEEE